MMGLKGAKMNALTETYTLHNGVKIPKIAFGTWQIPNEDVYQATLDALAVGYRHIDTAKSYHNEEGVGRAVKDSGVPREEIFVVSKLRAPAISYQATLDAFDIQLKELGLDYMDLYLIHAPWPWNDRGNSVTQENIEAWKAMETLYKAGKIRAIGVSNFSPLDLQAILDACDIVPMVNQIRFSVGFTQDETVAFCQKHNILIEAYSPLGTGSVFSDEKLKDIADRNSVSIAQLCLRYCLDKGTLPLPKTRSRDRMAENAKLDFILTQEDIALLDTFEEIDRAS
jgi:diketogulonate reductase-like aldo/keto reductase